MNTKLAVLLGALGVALTISACSYSIASNYEPNALTETHAASNEENKSLAIDYEKYYNQPYYSWKEDLIDGEFTFLYTRPYGTFRYYYNEAMNKTYCFLNTTILYSLLQSFDNSYQQKATVNFDDEETNKNFVIEIGNNNVGYKNISINYQPILKYENSKFLIKTTYTLNISTKMIGEQNFIVDTTDDITNYLDYEDKMWLEELLEQLENNQLQFITETIVIIDQLQTNFWYDYIENIDQTATENALQWVLDAPNEYGLYTGQQFQANYNLGFSNGKQEVKTNPNDYNLYTAEQLGQVAENANTEIIDLPGVMLHVLSMPWTFISNAFDLTLWPGTPYQINFANIFKGLIAILALMFIIKMFTNGFNALGNVASNAEDRKNKKADTNLKNSQAKLNDAKTKKIESKKE